MKKVIDFLRKTVFNRKWWDLENILSAGLYATIVIGAIIFTVFVYNTVDTSKATEQDYAPLYEQVEIIKEDFDKIYDMKNVQIDLDDNIIAKFKSEDCNLEVELNRERTQIISVNEVDKSKSVLLVIFIGILAGGSLGGILFLAILLLITGILGIVEFVVGKIKRNKV